MLLRLNHFVGKSFRVVELRQLKRLGGNEFVSMRLGRLITRTLAGGVGVTETGNAAWLPIKIFNLLEIN